MKKTNILLSLSRILILLVVPLCMIMRDMNITVALPYGVTVEFIYMMLVIPFWLICDSMLQKTYGVGLIDKSYGVTFSNTDIDDNKLSQLSSTPVREKDIRYYSTKISKSSPTPVRGKGIRFYSTKILSNSNPESTLVKRDSTSLLLSKLQFLSSNAKDIGVLYLIYALFAGLVGTAFSVLIRLELSGPGVQFIADNQLYNSIITAHAIIMIFFMIMPAFYKLFVRISIYVFFNYSYVIKYLYLLYWGFLGLYLLIYFFYLMDLCLDVSILIG